MAPKTKVKVFHLVNREPSQFVLKGTEGTPFEKRLDCPSEYRLLSESTTLVKEENEWVVKRIRYIEGCDTPFVEEQDKRGFIFNPQRDQIWFKHGALTAVDGPRTKGLFRYLEIMVANKDFPNRDIDIAPVFEEYKPVEEASKNIDLLQIEKEAVDLVLSLYKSKGDVKTFQHGKIDFLCTVFGCHADSYENKILALVENAKADPATFLNTVADQKNVYKVVILEALDLKVMSIEGSKLSLVSTQQIITELQKRNREERLDEMMQFFLMDEKGQQWYTEIQIQARAKKESALNGLVV